MFHRSFAEAYTRHFYKIGIHVVLQMKKHHKLLTIHNGILLRANNRVTEGKSDTVLVAFRQKFFHTGNQTRKYFQFVFSGSRQ